MKPELIISRVGIERDELNQLSCRDEFNNTRRVDNKATAECNQLNFVSLLAKFNPVALVYRCFYMYTWPAGVNSSRDPAGWDGMGSVILRDPPGSFAEWILWRADFARKLFVICPVYLQCGFFQRRRHQDALTDAAGDAPDAAQAAGGPAPVALDNWRTLSKYLRMKQKFSKNNKKKTKQ